MGRIKKVGTVMKRNEQITNLAEEIMLDITNSRLALNNILLKASHLSLLLDMPANVKTFKEWARYTEQNQFTADTFRANIESAKDRDISISSANPDQYVWNPAGNFMEREQIRDTANTIVSFIAQYRTETYNFALGVYAKWQFGNIAESIFEKKRRKSEPVLRAIFPDMNQRLNSIEQNINSDNAEDWKNAVASCRTLIVDIADILNPPQTAEDKGKYINRLKDFISPLVKSDTKKKLLNTYLEELKKRIEYTSDMTQGGSHTDRPSLEEAEDVVLYTYLLIADLMAIHKSRKPEREITNNKIETIDNTF